MRRDLRMYLADLHVCIEAIEEFTSRKSFEEFELQRVIRSAVRGELVVIGEAMSQMLHHFPETNTRISKAQIIVDFRNILIHQYSEVDEAILWSIVIDSLPTLKQEIKEWARDSAM